MAAGLTYTPITSTVISGTSTNQITFSSISSSYTDLIMVIKAGTTVNSGGSCYIRFNNDSTTIYSQTNLDGTGTSAVSDRLTGNSQIYIDYYGTLKTDLSSTIIVQINNYSNSTTYKAVLSRANNAGGGVDAIVGLWRSTSAINRIDFYPQSGKYFSDGSVVTLYGIAAA